MTTVLIVLATLNILLAGVLLVLAGRNLGAGLKVGFWPFAVASTAAIYGVSVFALFA
jgi:hypothetical protein